MSFDRAFQIVVGVEGGYSNDPQDPGGETKYGISRRAYPKLDIKALTLEHARVIYEQDYWNAAGCDRISNPVLAILVFDCAVNQGLSRAVQIENIARDPISYQAERALHYASLPTFQRFGRGWMRRLFSVLQQATEHE
jgi:lysozyme family protein